MQPEGHAEPGLRLPFLFVSVEDKDYPKHYKDNREYRIPVQPRVNTQEGNGGKPAQYGNGYQ
jgi:hypothetical protein